MWIITSYLIYSLKGLEFSPYFQIMSIIKGDMTQKCYMSLCNATIILMSSSHNESAFHSYRNNTVRDMQLDLDMHISKTVGVTYERFRYI